MADASLFDAVRIPTEILVALDYRPLEFAMQPYHYVIRLVHIIAMAIFFGGIALLDFRLIGWRQSIPLRSAAGFLMPAHYSSFVVTVITGLALFAFNPVHVGSHAYFAPKLLLIVIAGVNAAILHRPGNLQRLAGRADLPLDARIAGSISLAVWVGVLICSSMNVEGVPRVYLR